MIVQELFNDAYKFEWTVSGEREMTAYFKTDDNSTVMVDMSKGPAGSAFLAFTRNMRTKKTNEGDAPKILATVVLIAKQMVAKIKPPAILFSADKGEGESRAKLYRRMADRLSSEGYVRLKNSDDIKEDGELKSFLQREANRSSYDVITIIKKDMLK